MQKKHIIFTVTNNLEHDNRMHRICNTLVKNDFRVTLVGRRKLNSGTSPKFDFNSKQLTCYFSKGKFFYIEYNIRLFWFLLFKNHQIICAVDLDTILPCLFTSILRRRIFGYDAHEYFSEVPEVVDRPRIKRIWEWVARFSIPKTDFRYTVSPGLANEFSKRYNMPFELLRNVPDFSFDSIFPNPLPNEAFILYQGALNEGRGLEALIGAARHMSIQVIIAGEGDLSDELRKLVRHLKLQDQVHFLGYYTKESIAPYSQHALLGYCLLENKGKSYYFSLANKFFDYTNAFTPSLISAFPEYLALNQEYEVGLICEPDSEIIAKAVNMLINDYKKYSQLKRNCKLAAKEWNWNQEEKRLLKIYESYK